MTQITGFVSAVERPGALGVHSADNFTLVVPDLKIAEQFYRSFGLNVREEGNGLGLYTHGHSHRRVQVSEGPAKKTNHISFGAFEGDIAPIRARLQGHGVKQIDAPQGFEPNGFWFRDPEGVLIEVRVADKASPNETSRVSNLSTAPGAWGAPTGKRFVAWTIADCMVFENNIYREWIVRDTMGMILQLGLDGDSIARAMAESHVGEKVEEIGTSERALGQTPPHELCDTSIASSEMEADIIRALHAIWNRRMFGGVRKLYSERATVTIPCNRKLFGPGQIVGHMIAIMAMMPDAEFTCDHIATVSASIEGGLKVAVRWSLRGHHKGYGRLGAPTGKPLYMLGMTHMHIVDGKIVEEFMLYVELGLKAQTYLPR